VQVTHQGVPARAVARHPYGSPSEAASCRPRLRRTSRSLGVSPTPARWARRSRSCAAWCASSSPIPRPSTRSRSSRLRARCGGCRSRA